VGGGVGAEAGDDGVEPVAAAAKAAKEDGAGEAIPGWEEDETEEVLSEGVTRVSFERRRGGAASPSDDPAAAGSSVEA